MFEQDLQPDVAAALWTSLDSAVVSPSLSPSWPWPDHLRRALSWLCASYTSIVSGCLRSSRLVPDSRRASGLLCGSRLRRALAFGREQIPRMLESVFVLFSHVQERELVAHHVEVNPLPAQLRALGRDGLRSLESFQARRRRTLRLPQSSREPCTRRCQHLLPSSSASRHGSSLPRYCSLAQSRRNCAFALVPFVDWYAFSCSGVIFRSMAAYSFERVLIPASALCYSAHSSFSSARLSFCDSACSAYFLTVSSHFQFL